MLGWSASGVMVFSIVAVGMGGPAGPSREGVGVGVGAAGWVTDKQLPMKDMPCHAMP